MSGATITVTFVFFDLHAKINPHMYTKINQNSLASLEMSLSILLLPLRAKEEEFIFVICVHDLPNGFVLLKKQWNTPKKAFLKFLFIKQYVIGWIQDDE